MTALYFITVYGWFAGMIAFAWASEPKKKRSQVMIKIVGYFSDRTVSRKFKCVFDAMDYRDQLDAHYAKVEWIQL